MLQLLCHLTGDFLFQNSWMALNKFDRWEPAIAHGFAYTLPFLLITQDWRALAVIGTSHVLSDHFRLASLVPRLYNWHWEDWQWFGWQADSFNPAKQPSAFPDSLSWVNTVIDASLHLWINYLVLQ